MPNGLFGPLIRRLLAGRAEIQIARQITRRFRGVVADIQIQRRFPGLTRLQARLLRRSARRGMAAGRLLEVRGPLGKLPVAEIPINRFLFGDDPAGRRFFFNVEVRVPITGELINIGIESGLNLDKSEIIQEALGEAFRIFVSYEDKFEEATVSQASTALGTVTFAERRF